MTVDAAARQRARERAADGVASHYQVVIARNLWPRIHLDCGTDIDPSERKRRYRARRRAAQRSAA